MIMQRPYRTLLITTEAPPDQGAHETSASTTDADLEHSDSEDSYSEDSDSEDFELEENAREVMSKCRELVQKSRQSKRKYEEIHQADAETYRQYVTAAEKQSSELLNDRNAIFAQLVLAEAEIKKLRSWKSRHITKKKCLESQLKQLQEKFEIEKCPICGDRVAEAETKCGHFFCWGCLWNWHVQQRNLTAGIHTCAMCRRYLGDIDCGLEELATPRKRSRRNGNSISVL